MITKEDFEALIEFLDVVKVPENLEKFHEKIKIMYEEILLREEMQKKATDIHERLNALDKEEQKEE